MSLMKSLEIKIGADTRGFSKGVRNVQSGVKKINTSLGTLAKGAMALAGISAGIAGVVKSMKDYVVIRNAVQRVNEIFGEHSKVLKDFSNVALESFGMSESAALEYANVYGNIFSQITKDAKDNAKVTANFLQTTAIISSKTGRTIEDVASRLQSGIMGNVMAIRELGLVVPASAVKASKAFKELSDGRSWEQLDYNTQLTIRSLAILEQATTKYGDSVTMISGYSLNRMASAFRDLTTYAGMFLTSALQPLINAMAKFAIVTTQALKSLAAFLGLDLGGKLATDFVDLSETQGDYADNINDATEALKKQKKMLAGFDELTVLNPSDDDAGFGGLYKDAFAGMQDVAFDIKEPDIKWVSKVAETLKGLTKTLTENLSPAITAFKDLFDSLKEPFQNTVQSIGDTLSFLWADVFKPLGDHILNDFITPVINSFALNFAPIFEELLPTVWGVFSDAFQATAEAMKSVSETIIQPIFEGIKTVTIGVFDSIKTAWDKYGGELTANFRIAWDNIKSVVQNFWEVFKPIIDMIGDRVSTLWGNHIKPFTDAFYKAFMSLINVVLSLWNNALAPYMTWFAKTFQPYFSFIWDLVVTSATNAVGFIFDIFENMLNGLAGVFDGIVGLLTRDMSKAFDGFGRALKSWVNHITELVLFPINTIIKGINVLIRAANNLGANMSEISLMGQPTAPATPSASSGTSGKGGTQQRFARGIVVDSPTRALIGEAGKEAIVPLENNTGWIREFARELANRMPTTSTTTSGEQYVVVNLGNEHLGTFIAKSTQRNNFRTNGKAVMV